MENAQGGLWEKECGERLYTARPVSTVDEEVERSKEGKKEGREYRNTNGLKRYKGCQKLCIYPNFPHSLPQSSYKSPVAKNRTDKKVSVRSQNRISTVPKKKAKKKTRPRETKSIYATIALLSPPCGGGK